MKKIGRLLYKVADTLAVIFRDSPSWAEITSAFGGFVYCGLAVGSIVFLEKEPQDWQSIKLIAELIGGQNWVIISFSVATTQFCALLTQLRFVRATAAFLMLSWHIVTVLMAWPVVPWAPVLAFPIALCFPNFFAIARHARDWGR